MKDAEGSQGWGELDLGETCAQGWSKKNGIMTTSSKEVSLVAVTSGTAVEISLNSSDCYFESNTVGEKSDTLTACSAKHTPTKSRP